MRGDPGEGVAIAGPAAVAASGHAVGGSSDAGDAVVQAKTDAEALGRRR